MRRLGLIMQNVYKSFGTFDHLVRPIWQSVLMYSII